jgi:hypothetical protein
MSLVFLKVKIKSLAAEAAIIRKEEQKRPKIGMTGTRFELQQHRRYIVRDEARSAQLAYGFLRGKPYRSMEAKTWVGPDRVRIAEIAIKFGYLNKKEAVQQITDWLNVELPLQVAA